MILSSLRHFQEFLEKEKHAEANWAEGCDGPIPATPGERVDLGLLRARSDGLCREELGQGPSADLEKKKVGEG
jgi:hypothetical protein